MYKYPKIETVYKRDMEGTKQLIEGDFRDKTVEMLAEFPIWDCYEKLDGSNHQIFWDGHSLTLGGRTENSNIPKRVVEYYNRKFNNNETEELFEQMFHDRQKVLYFEAIGEKIQTFGAKYGEVRFVLLDVYDVNNNSWLSYDLLKDLALALNVECKFLYLESSTLGNAIELVRSKPFSIHADGSLPIEGVVCLPKCELKDWTGNRVIVKIKGCDFCPDWEQFMKKYKK